MVVTAIGLFVVGLLITSVNFYLSWIRVPVWRRLRNNDELRSVSGFPLVGSGALWLCAALLPAGSALTPWALGASLLDTGGLHWFIGTQLWSLVRRRRK